VTLLRLCGLRNSSCYFSHTKFWLTLTLILTSEKMNSHNVQYLLNISIGRGWLLKQFALSADSFNTSHHKLPLFQLTPIIHVRFW